MSKHYARRQRAITLPANIAMEIEQDLGGSTPIDRELIEEKENIGKGKNWK